jgi:hypothetical protein
MSKFAELDWEIEFRACEEGMSAWDIAKDLNIPLDVVNGWFREHGIWDADEHSPYATVNS